MNMIRIYREKYLKHTVTELEAFNEPSSTNFPVLGNYSCDFDFGNFSPLSFDVPLTQNSKINFQVNLFSAVEESIFYQEPLLGTTDKEYRDEKITRPEEVAKFFS
jgi:hypothetical protein